VYHTSILDKKDEALKEDINRAHKRHTAYGHRRLAIHLEVNHKRVSRVMKKYGIKPPRRKGSGFCTQSVAHCSYLNLLSNLSITYQHQVWCSDTSVISFHGMKWYIVTVIDIFTREVVGIAIGRHHDSALVQEALEDAICRTKTVPTIFHTDQGSEFMAERITSFLKSLQVQISVSAKASPWQNGYQESFFGRLKNEWGDMNRFETVGEFIEEMYHLIHYYNTERIHTALKMPPSRFAESIRNLSDKMGT